MAWQENLRFTSRGGATGDPDRRALQSPRHLTFQMAWLMSALCLMLLRSAAVAAEDAPKAGTSSTQAAAEEKPAAEEPAKTVDKKPAAEKGVMREPAQQSSPKQDPALTDVQQWIQNLDSDVYAERQAAMKNLRRSGTSGITALAAAARGSNLEATARAIELLTQLYESPDPEVAMAADEALEGLGENGPAVAVVRTQQVLSTTLGPIRRRHAIAAIKRLGGNIIATMVLDDEGEKEVEADLNDEGTIAHVVLGRKWTGGLSGIKYLQRLPDLRYMSITKDIALTPEEQDQLRTKLSGVRIDIRSSAYLGIKSQSAVPETCIIHTVVPKSPADRAGLLAEDEITHLDGLRVNGFLALTALLGEKRGGDVVYLEVNRGGEFLEIEVTLGEW